MLKKGLENNYEDSNRCKHSKPAIDIFKTGRGRNTPKSNTDVAWSRKSHLLRQYPFQVHFWEILSKDIKDSKGDM